MLARALLVWLLAPTIVMITVAFSIPMVVDWIHVKHPKYEWYALCFILIVNLISYVQNIVIPFVESSKILRLKQLQLYAGLLANRYPQYCLSINIMIPKRVFWHKCEANGKFSKSALRGKLFKMLHLHGNRVSAQFRLSIEQGICGKAFADGADTSTKFCFFKVQSFDFLLPFNNEQLPYISDLTFLASLTIADPNNRDRKYGVLNIESKVDSISELFHGQQLNAEFEYSCQNLKNSIETLISTKNFFLNP